MSKSAIFVTGAAIAVISAAVILLGRPGLPEGRPTTASNYAADSTLDPSAVETVDLGNTDRATEAPTLGDGFDDASLFGRASPTEIENALYQRIAERPGLRLVTLSVECGTLRCNVVFSGVETNPHFVDEYRDLQSALSRPPWHDYQPTQGSWGTREVSPGVREYVMELTYVALVDLSADPEIAAQQHAACAGAWARVTELRGSEEYIRTAHEQAAKYLELGAATLGPEEAKRIAARLEFGPLTRECGALPY